jgi:hypothetical protein
MLRNKTFYPEIIGKIVSDDFDIVLDNGQNAKIRFVNSEDNPLAREVIQEYFQKKAKHNAKEQSVNKLKKKLMDDEEYQKEVSNKVISENPDIVSNPMKLVQKINEEIEKIARERVLRNFTVRIGSIIKFAGITNYDKEGNLIITSKSINPEVIDKGGVYMFAVLKQKIPLQITQTKQGKFLVRLSPLANEEQINELIEQFMRTYKAYKDGKINNLPRLYISTKVEQVKDIVEYINNEEKPDIVEYAKKVKAILKWYLKAPTLANIYLPLGVSADELNEILKNVVDDIAIKLIRTTFAKFKEHDIRLKEEIAKAFWGIYNEKKLLFNTAMYVNDKYGFFPNSIDLENLVLSSNNYTTIISEVSNITKDFL